MGSLAFYSEVGLGESLRSFLSIEFIQFIRADMETNFSDLLCT